MADMLPEQVITQGADCVVSYQHCTRANKTSAVFPVSLRGCKLRIQIRAAVASPQVLDELTTENGRIVITDDENGIYKLLFPVASTQGKVWSRAVGDLEIIYADGTVDRLWRQKYRLDQEVTR